jgi:6-phosphogluconolactonase
MARTLLFTGSCNRGLPYVAETAGAGISAYFIDLDTGAAEAAGVFGDVDNPTYLGVSPDGTKLGAVSEYPDARFGKASFFAIDRTAGTVSPTGAGDAAGYTTAQLSFDRTGAFAAVANYSAAPLTAPPGASIAIFRVGEPNSPVATATHEGSGPNKARQERSHAHCVAFSPDNRFLAVADLGIDQLVIYSFDATNGAIARQAEITLPAGSGPRHLAFHPTKPFAYVVTELDSTLVSFAYDAATGGFTQIGIERALAPTATQPTTASGIKLSPDGQHVFSANRGDDSIAQFDIDADGIARFAGTVPSGGRTPRDLAFDATGTLLAVANQDSDLVSLFRLTAGRLTPLADIAVGSPTGVVFLPN